MRIHDILTERVVNAFDAAQKAKYADKVWDMLQTAYKDIGGFGSAASVEELLNTPGLWKLVVRDGEVTAVNIYRDAQGRKSIASATNQSLQGIKDYKMIKGADVKYRRAWAEVSRTPAAILKKFGATPIPSKYAQLLTGKHIMDYNPDGVHYTRLIAGEPHEKIMYGVVKMSPDMVEKFKAAGIDIHSLPDNFDIDYTRKQ